MKEMKGSFTVEAAFVMPLVIFTIWAVIAGIFFLHDQALIQSMGYRQLEAETDWNVEKTGQLCLLNIQQYDMNRHDEKLEGVINVIAGIRKTDIRIRASGDSDINGIQALIGQRFNTDFCAQDTRWKYTDDWLRWYIAQMGENNP